MNRILLTTPVWLGLVGACTPPTRPPIVDPHYVTLKDAVGEIIVAMDLLRAERASLAPEDRLGLWACEATARLELGVKETSTRQTTGGLSGTLVVVNPISVQAGFTATDEQVSNRGNVLEIALRNPVCIKPDAFFSPTTSSAAQQAQIEGAVRAGSVGVLSVIPELRTE